MVGRLIRVGLVMFAIVLVAGWMMRRIVPSHNRMRVQREAPAVDAALGPGDLRIYNSDSSVDVVLQGSRLLAGLSPKTIAKIRGDLERSSTKDTNGLGGLIASTVKQTVANTIGTHVVYSVAEIRSLRYEDGRIVLEREDGSTTRLFGNTKVNREEAGRTFSAEDVARLNEAVQARKAELGALPGGSRPD